MAVYVDAKILDGLMTRLAAFTIPAGIASRWPGYTSAMIAAPNVPFTPGQRYLRASILRNTTRQITLGTAGYNRHVGIFQVDVMWPENGGETSPVEIAGAIAAHFKRGTTFTYQDVIIRITMPPTIAPGLQSPPSYMVPVSIAYQADAPNPA